MTDQERRTTVSVRLTVEPAMGDAVGIERTIQFENPMPRRDELDRLESLIAEAVATIRQFYGVQEGR